MYEYIKGIVKDNGNNYIVLENNGVGYFIYTSNSYSYKLESEYTVYIYQYVKEDENTLYGFRTKDEKDFFLKLIEVKGLGCKMALPMFSNNSINNILEAIEKEDISYLKKFPKIGDKVARQIVLDLKGKLVSNNSYDNIELLEALKTLGYKNQDIKNILPNVSKSESLENQLKEALKLLRK